MRQRLLALALALGLVCVGPVLAGDMLSPAINSIDLEFGPGIDPNGMGRFGPGIDPSGLKHGPTIDSGGLSHSPGLEPGGLTHGPVVGPSGFLKNIASTKASFGPGIDPSGMPNG